MEPAYKAVTDKVNAFNQNGIFDRHKPYNQERSCRRRSDFLAAMTFLFHWKRLDALSYPVEDLSKAEFVPIHRTVDELVSDQAFDFDVEAVPPQEDIRSCESDPFVAVGEAVVVAEGLHQCGGFFCEGGVV